MPMCTITGPGSVPPSVLVMITTRWETLSFGEWGDLDDGTTVLVVRRSACPHIQSNSDWSSTIPTKIRMAKRQRFGWIQACGEVPRDQTMLKRHLPTSPSVPV